PREPDIAWEAPFPRRRASPAWPQPPPGPNRCQPSADEHRHSEAQRGDEGRPSTSIGRTDGATPTHLAPNLLPHLGQGEAKRIIQRSSYGANPSISWPSDKRFHQ